MHTWQLIVITACVLFVVIISWTGYHFQVNNRDNSDLKWKEKEKREKEKQAQLEEFDTKLISIINRLISNDEITGGIMNKQQQIKEIAKAIPKIVDNKGKERSLHGDSKYIAKILYDAGCRIIPDSAIILTPEKLEAFEKGVKTLTTELKNELAEHEAFTVKAAEEIQRLNTKNEKFTENMKNVLEIEKKQAVKEFAEKVKAKSYTNNCCREAVEIEKIDELLKEYEKW